MVVIDGWPNTPGSMGRLLSLSTKMEDMSSMSCGLLLVLCPVRFKCVESVSMTMAKHQLTPESADCKNSDLAIVSVMRAAP